MRLSDLRLFSEPQQGASYDSQVAAAQHAERLGFGGYFRSDHFLPFGWDGLPGPTEAWVTLAGIARETSTIRLGTLVTSATFRAPGILAVTVAQVDQMSGGRVELGLGAGWFGAEHEAMGVPFPPLGDRFDLLEDQLAIIEGAWSTEVGSTFSYEGKAQSVRGSTGLPKPAQEHVPIIIGGKGRKRTPRIAVRYADEFNTAIASFEDFVAARERVLAEAERQGRERPILFSTGVVLAVGRTEAEFRRRAEAVRRDPDELRAIGGGGTVNEVADAMRRWNAAGADRLYLQTFDLRDLDHLELVATEVAPLLA